MRSIIVHGGAGAERDTDREPRRRGVERAAAAGWDVLARGGSALDAVIAATIVLEDDEHFNAGYGSVLADDGWAEMDASLMDGGRLAAGAVAAVRRVRNPIRAARAVMDAGREVLMVGDAACDVAARAGVPLADPRDLVAPRARESWARRSGGTVGAVARDAAGHVAAATSTGGIAGKRRGRVGDSALIGAGTYADDTLGAVSCTGSGEAIIKLGLARVALTHVAAGAQPDAACRLALDALRTRIGEEAGLIVVAADGRIGFHHTTASMPVARRDGRDAPPASAG